MPLCGDSSNALGCFGCRRTWLLLQLDASHPPRVILLGEDGGQEAGVAFIRVSPPFCLPNLHALASA
jgi:hypothetical protein